MSKYSFFKSWHFVVALSIQPNKTLEAGDKPALNKVCVGSTNFVLGGKQSTNLRSGVSKIDFTNS
jgi:hypothetical protein